MSVSSFSCRTCKNSANSKCFFVERDVRARALPQSRNSERTHRTSGVLFSKVVRSHLRGFAVTHNVPAWLQSGLLRLHIDLNTSFYPYPLIPDPQKHFRWFISQQEPPPQNSTTTVYSLDHNCHRYSLHHPHVHAPCHAFVACELSCSGTPLQSLVQVHVKNCRRRDRG